MKKNLSRLKSPGNCYCWGKTKHFLQTRKCVLMFRHLLTTNKAGSGVRRGARVAALTRCSHRFTALRGSVLWTERPRHRPLSSRPSSGPALPAPPLRAGQMNRWGPDGPRQPSAPGPAGRAGHQQAGAFGAAGCRAALPAARERLWGAAARLGPGGEPRWSVRSWGGLTGPVQPPRARAARRSPTEAPAGPGRGERGGPRPVPPAPPARGASAALCARAQPSLLPRASAAPIEMREVLRFLPAKNKEAAAFIKAGPDEYGSDKFV
ncbi:uncharacterized protein LOC116450119 [Corvus moneduloides]|uniref:uncharacterized protein LOC116450119 n=1 Tax=Corvus moneduloides TaxID=1196302 RepID=UPI00136422BE|nr:uncharacterized protein LOC116450119 [Corvus moneduloides]